MGARLLFSSPLPLVASAVRMCTGTRDKMDSDDRTLGPRDRKLIADKILKLGEAYDPLNPTHESTLEHAYYTYEIEFSRACLQELARHRIASPSVESTRWALARILKNTQKSDMAKFLTLTGDAEVDDANIEQLCKVAQWTKPGPNKKKNDVVKFAIPEAFRTKVQFTINIRSLRNWMALRTSPRALWEIRETAREMFEELPEDHKFLFQDRVHPQEG